MNREKYVENIVRNYTKEDYIRMMKVTYEMWGIEITKNTDKKLGDQYYEICKEYEELNKGKKSQQRIEDEDLTEGDIKELYYMGYL